MVWTFFTVFRHDDVNSHSSDRLTPVIGHSMTGFVVSSGGYHLRSQAQTRSLLEVIIGDW